MDTAGHLAQLGEKSLQYLDQKASESFKRQLDLEESIWRSLPFFAGALIAASAMLVHAATNRPPILLSLYSIINNGLLCLSGLAFAASFVWLTLVPWPRDTEYPARDDAVAQYASEMATFHAQSGAKNDAVDDAVVRELRAYMVKQYGEAAQSHFDNNQARLSARSQVLLFLAYGFLLAFACEATTFGHELIYGGKTPGVIDHASNAHPANTAGNAVLTNRPPESSASKDHPRGRVGHQDQRVTASPEQINAGRRQTSFGIDAKDHRPAIPLRTSQPTAKADVAQDRTWQGAGGKAAALREKDVGRVDPLEPLQRGNNDRLEVTTPAKASRGAADPACPPEAHEG